MTKRGLSPRMLDLVLVYARAMSPVPHHLQPDPHIASEETIIGWWGRLERT